MKLLIVFAVIATPILILLSLLFHKKAERLKGGGRIVEITTFKQLATACRVSASFCMFIIITAYLMAH